MKRPPKELMEEILSLRQIVELGVLSYHGSTREVQQNAAHEFEARALDYLRELRNRREDEALDKQIETGRCSDCGQLVLECRCD